MGKTSPAAIATSDIHVLTAQEYHKALLLEIPKAQRRITVAAMIVVWGERTAPLFELLKSAAKRGVQVTVLLDNYTRLSARYNLQPRKSRNERVKRTFTALEELSALGATIHCLGKIGLSPYKGRCHVKVTVVDDNYYSFGGVNLYDQCFENTDYMLAGKNPVIADCLHELVTRIGTSQPPLTDGEVVINKKNLVLFDGGRPGHSLIYERACELAAQAKQIHLVSNFTPSGPLANLMHETSSVAYFNRPEQMIAPDAWGQAFDQKRYQILNAHMGSNFLHAKFMLFELRGGKKVVLSGSHNFSYRGVAFGVQELALESSDPALWKQLHQFIHDQVLGKL